jgi:hypothetical protein
LRYAYGVLDEIYDWQYGMFEDEMFLSNIVALVKNKIDDEMSFGKNKEKVLQDLKILLIYLVDELKDFYISNIDNNRKIKYFFKTNDFFKFIEKNNINIFDEIFSYQTTLSNQKEKAITPQNIPEYIHQIFEPYLFCELKTK